VVLATDQKGMGMNSRALMRLIIFSVALSLSVAGSVLTSARSKQKLKETRLSQLVEANVIATHAYQVLLAKKSGKGDPNCYGAGKLSDRQLEELVEHQARLLRSNIPAVKTWVRGAESGFDPAQDLESILSAGLTVPRRRQSMFSTITSTARPSLQAQRLEQ
jgi:hypothetical protein